MKYLDLLTAFFLVILVDTDIINPQKSWLIGEPEALEGVRQGAVYRQYLTIALDTVAGRISPSI